MTPLEGSDGVLATITWNDTPLNRRPSDGYVNATAMCKANGKRWSDYRESDRCQQYLDALSQTTEIPVFDLIQSRQGQGGGTWIHQDIATELARWISPDFSVFVNQWFRQALEHRAAPVVPVVELPPSAHEAKFVFEELAPAALGFLELVGLPADTAKSILARNLALEYPATRPLLKGVDRLLEVSHSDGLYSPSELYPLLLEEFEPDQLVVVAEYLGKTKKDGTFNHGHTQATGNLINTLLTLANLQKEATSTVKKWNLTAKGQKFGRLHEAQATHTHQTVLTLRWFMTVLEPLKVEVNRILWDEGWGTHKDQPLA